MHLSFLLPYKISALPHPSSPCCPSHLPPAILAMQFLHRVLLLSLALCKARKKRGLTSTPTFGRSSLRVYQLRSIIDVAKKIPIVLLSCWCCLHGKNCLHCKTIRHSSSWWALTVSPLTGFWISLALCFQATRLLAHWGWLSNLNMSVGIVEMFN